MREIGPGVYVESAFQGGNVGLVVMDEGTLLIDTPMMPWEAHEWSRTVEEIAGDSVRFVINTDHSPERSLGNQFFSAPIVGHESGWKEVTSYSESYRQRLIDSLQTGDTERDTELSELTLAPPNLTLATRLMLYFGDKGVQLIHVGGYACSSVLVYLQEEKILFTGNVVVHDTHPVLAHADSKQWLSVLTRIRRMPFDTLVPGHGEPGDGELTEAVSAYIRRVRSGVRHHYRAGHSKAETYSKLLTLLDSFPVTDAKRDRVEQQFKAGVNQVYEELRTEKQD